MKRFLSVLGNAIYSTFAFIARTPRLAHFFGILGNAIFLTAIVLALAYFGRWPNGELYRVMIIYFFLGFVIGGCKSKFVSALLEAGRRFLKACGANGVTH
jgi:hypothetical protein